MKKFWAFVWTVTWKQLKTQQHKSLFEFYCIKKAEVVAILIKGIFWSNETASEN